MSILLKQLMQQNGYMDQADDGSGGGPGGNGGGDGGDNGAGGGAGGSGDGAGGQSGAAGGNGDAGQGGAGKGKPSDEEARLLKENMKRKADLQKATEELGKLQSQLKQFEGIDPEQIKKMLHDQKDAETKALEAKGDYERLKTRMAEEHGKEIKTLQEQLEAAQSQLGKANGTISELTIGTQFGQSKFILEELTLTPGKARVIYADYFDIEDGKVTGYDKPRGATNRTALVDQYGNAVAFDDAMRKIVEADPEKDHLLKSKVKPGAASDSRKPDASGQKKEGANDSVSKIAAGLKGFKV